MKYLHQCENDLDLAEWVRTVRLLSQTDWFNRPVFDVEVSPTMYDALFEQAKHAPQAGTGWDLFVLDDKVMVTRFPITVRPE